ncbi:hypothetical protein A2641_00590 [Candidatus Nomurabacteria bacterium RIFCSPHIGHO2_01_FULL_37_25]|uniref:Uncharacterized protein n=1 Tax=Candidatus Nomurabacteria bacterium RIFCSPLOWO2_01_FULL_36_16 TaxID=1801767 RepID=A0A1F6WYC2_9BACT|nr:MAG: hypothetical protein A2641_00590 [Candidatus Nomurabacteria bacterium RIFCSPHIGHO2_01_FULL_37_25]OGI75241.1 MAG: hypothetical protein A3D36_03840 [Candidatus Nomurabacteria bacterium RIFCSPHIGHO2_02_FULL_36_29]OGI86870.1 MAG: hypothetical protein A3A91_03300 [Candidatus Nomurabacteria bacterium RIFCSPLOWO2_01_FULL_36_16]OGI94843.1 MAG: hypothetical protein A3I84_01505 [Candidatus Nomurabacteria bacterium RIFCSPLOWO2_02_FULL_36_8]
MLSGDKNLKDGVMDLDVSRKDSILSMSYTKTQKLVTALYIVTDIIDKEEPIRNKLRTLGVEILSDTSSMSKTLFDTVKIDQVLSFLNISLAMNFISEMNYTILKKEFLELKASIQDYTAIKPTWLEEFFLTPSPEDVKPNISSFAQHTNPKGHIRIGVQKGSTLLKALNKVGEMRTLSDKKLSSERAETFFRLKKERRDNIINIIKNNGGNSTIKDIKIKINTGAQGADVCSEKTLQRELMSMIKDGVLYKTGEKRWSRYSLVAS